MRINCRDTGFIPSLFFVEFTCQIYLFTYKFTCLHTNFTKENCQYETDQRREYFNLEVISFLLISVLLESIKLMIFFIIYYFRKMISKLIQH